MTYIAVMMKPWTDAGAEIAPFPDLDGGLDRAGNERRAPDFTERLRADPSSLFLILRGNEPLLRGGPETPRLDLLDRGGLAARGGADPALPLVFLGLDAATRRGVFAVGVARDAAADSFAPGRFGPLRASLLQLPPAEAAIVAHGAALLHWREQTRFCSACGHGLGAVESGLVLQCDSCGRQHFARTDPAVIMLVTHRDADGVERALLARSPRFGDRRVLSMLAGFVEPGERLEDAVVREVLEEVGIRVDSVRYHSSQPWPFPAQIMLGFTAATADPALALDPQEIVEAHWLTRAQIAARRDAAGAEFLLPGQISIARRMIEDWLAADPGAGQACVSSRP